MLRALGVIPGTLTSCLEGPHAQGKGGGERRRRKVYSGANAVNEEDPERDRATQV